MALVAALSVFALLYDIPTIGESAEWRNGHYYFAGGTTPWAIALALLVIVLYLSLLYASPAAIDKPLPGVFRRFVAFWIDFMIAMTAIGPIVGVLPVITEWKRTGVFAWNFARTTPARGDTLQAGIGLLCCSVVLVFYFALPLVRRRPSPGCCVLGYQVVFEEGKTPSLGAAILRTLLGFLAVCAAYLAPFVGRDRKKGKFWLDKIFGTQAVKLA